MKTALLHVADDPGQEARLEAASAVVQTFGAHLTVVQAMPYGAFVMTDPFGGVHPSIALLSEVESQQEAARAVIEARLLEKNIAFEWVRESGPPAAVLLDHSRLTDLIILSHGSGGDQTLDLVGDLSVHARAPILSVPYSSGRLRFTGTAVIAWNGSFEAAQALRLSLPLLRRASRIEIITVAGGRPGFSIAEAKAYLSHHGLVSDTVEWQRGSEPVSERLLRAFDDGRADYAVIGAYGHSRLRERILGGVTREMLLRSPIPLLLAH